MIHASLGQNVRVDEQNRRHGQKSGETGQHFTARAHPGCAQLEQGFNHIISHIFQNAGRCLANQQAGKQPAATASPAQLSAAHKALLALLPDLAVLVVLSAVGLTRIAALGF